MMAPARIGDPVDAVDTPALLLDLDAMQANLLAVHRKILNAGLSIRVHGKAHKCPALAQRQIAAGAIGICCQKVSEAEAFVDSGIADVLISNEVIGAGKLDRLVALTKRARVAVCVDHLEQLAQLDAALLRGNASIDVLIEVDVGQGRCGVTTVEQALALARAIRAAQPRMHLRGLQAYHGKAQHLRTPRERREAVIQAASVARDMRDALRENGFEVQVVTGGGTGSYGLECASKVYTEVQPGSYVLMDADYRRNQLDPDAPVLAQALHVLCSVISTRPGQVVLDGGLKAFAVDSGLPDVELAGWRATGISDEHLVLRTSEGAAPIAIGEKIQLVPGHCDPTVNLHDWIVGVRGGRVAELWPIAARGAVF